MAYNGLDLSSLNKFLNSPLWKRKQQEWLDSNYPRFIKIKKEDIQGNLDFQYTSYEYLRDYYLGIG